MVENVVDLERSFQLVTAEGEVAAERQVAGVPGLGMVLRDVGHRLIAFARVYETVPASVPAGTCSGHRPPSPAPARCGHAWRSASPRVPRRWPVPFLPAGRRNRSADKLPLRPIRGPNCG